MNIIVVIPLTNYPETSDRRKLVQNLRDLATKIEDFDNLIEEIDGHQHLEEMANMIARCFPDSLPRSGMCSIKLDS